MICEIENSTNYLQAHKIWFSRVIIIFIKSCNFHSFRPVAILAKICISKFLKNFQISGLRWDQYPDLNPKTKSFLWKKLDF